MPAVMRIFFDPSQAFDAFGEVARVHSIAAVMTDDPPAATGRKLQAVSSPDGKSCDWVQVSKITKGIAGRSPPKESTLLLRLEEDAAVEPGDIVVHPWISDICQLGAGAKVAVAAVSSLLKEEGGRAQTLTEEEEEEKTGDLPNAFKEKKKEENEEEEEEGEGAASKLAVALPLRPGKMEGGIR
eukprot:jgi/Bigna1/132483/aug1.17_g7191